MVAIVASKVMRIGSDKLYDPFIQKILKFIYSEKVTKYCKMSTVELSYRVTKVVADHGVEFSG